MLLSEGHPQSSCPSRDVSKLIDCEGYNSNLHRFLRVSKLFLRFVRLSVQRSHGSNVMESRPFRARTL